LRRIEDREVSNDLVKVDDKVRRIHAAGNNTEAEKPVWKHSDDLAGLLNGVSAPVATGREACGDAVNTKRHGKRTVLDRILKVKYDWWRAARSKRQKMARLHFHEHLKP
jgi:hypothetical protein